MEAARARPDDDLGTSELALHVGEKTLARCTTFVDVDDRELIPYTRHRGEAGRVWEAERHLPARREAHAMVVRDQRAAFDLFRRVKWKRSYSERGVLRLRTCKDTGHDMSPKFEASNSACLRRRGWHWPVG